MTKYRSIKSALLLAFTAIVLIALVEPISANNTIQGNIYQTSTMSSDADKQINTTICMTNQSAGIEQTNLDCSRYWLKTAIELHSVHLRNPVVAANKSSQIELMNQMKQAYACLTGTNNTENLTMGMINESVGNESVVCSCSTQVNTNCARLWLGKSIQLHQVHLTNPKVAANISSQIEMMNQMKQAYNCLTGENVTIETNQNATCLTRLDCADALMQKAIVLQNKHLKDPNNMTTNESQQVMDLMMQAQECIVGKSATPV